MSENGERKVAAKATEEGEGNNNEEAEEGHEGGGATTTTETAAEGSATKEEEEAMKEGNDNNRVPQKYKLGTAFLKNFGNQDYLGEVVSFDDESGFYHIKYEDSDEEDLEEGEVTELMNDTDEFADEIEGRLEACRARRAQKNKKKKKAASSSPPKSTTRSGRSVSKVNYAMPDLDDLVDEMERDDDDDDDEDGAAAPAKKKQRTSKKPEGSSSSKKKRKSAKSDSDSEASIMEVEEDDDDDDDLVMGEEEEDDSEEGETKEKPRKRGRGRSAGRGAGSGAAGGGGATKKTMVESFVPTNAPVYARLPLEEIQREKQYLDPGGMEATDDIIDHLVGDQVVKIGSLLTRALDSGASLGSATNPLRLGTACSGTDAPALALMIVQEQMEQRLGISAHKQEEGTNGNKAPKLHFQHVASCENDPFKQAYLARNFESDLYPDIGKLCDEELRDVYGQVKPLQPFNMFIAGTSCKNFSMLRSKFRLDIEDRGCSGETFLAAVEVVFKMQPPFVIFENVKGAPWAKMAEYLTGRVKLSNCNNSKAIKREGKDKKKDLTFSLNSEGAIEVEEVPDVYGVRCGSKVAGYLKGTEGEVHPIEWPNGKKKTCTLEELIKANKISKQSDTLVFETPCTYCAHSVDVDTKKFGLPQTRQRTYMFVWQAEHQDKNSFKSDDLGLYMEAIVRHLEAPVKHSLEAFLLQVDHDIIRVFREALCGPPGRETKRRCFQEPDFWNSTANANLAHNKTVRERIGMEDRARPVTNWDAFGKKQVALHYWLEYLNCNPSREIDAIDIWHGCAARDAESHDSNFASFFWNISQNVTKEKHRTATPGIAGCITPGGDFFLPHQGRPLLGCEKLLVQGIPYFRLALGNETEVQLGDLAGNAMSLTVVCATILASVCAPQLREEIRATVNKGTNGNSKKHKGVTQAMIAKYLDDHGSGAGDNINIEKVQGNWNGEIPSGMEFYPKESDDVSSLAFMKELSNLAPAAVKSSIWCTCETSGSNSRTNQFLQCTVCKVSCCRNCIHAHAGYNIQSHDTEDVEIGNGNSADSTDDVRNIGSFQAKLRNILPPTVYFPRESINRLADVEDDCYRIRGLDKFTFGLHRLRRDRGKWLANYYARENNGIGEAVAELKISIGVIERGQDKLGVLCELTSFVPARTEPLQYGKMDPCARIIIPCNSQGSSEENLQWQVKMPASSEAIQISGEGSTQSFRLEVGLNDMAEASIKDYCKGAGKRNFDAAKERGEERRWLYPPNWKEWPESIRIRCFEIRSLDKRIPGIYKRAKCQQTANQSALWIKEGSDECCSIYILIKPNINRNGPDNAIITTSMDHNDASSILCEFDPKWQPSDALIREYASEEEAERGQRPTVRCSSWNNDDAIACMVPASTIRVKSGKQHEDNLIVIDGLKETDVVMLCGSTKEGKENNVVKLSLSSGHRAQQITRVMNSTIVAPVLKFASMEGLKYDLDPRAEWRALEPQDNVPFGFCLKTCPVRPTELWAFDSERGTWERSSEPGASRKYYLELQEAPKPFDFWLNKAKGILEVKCNPHVVAHHAAANLLRGRGIETNTRGREVAVSFRLSDIGQQSDPLIDPFKVGNCSSWESTPVELNHPHQLYDRQQKVVSKMVEIEKGVTQFEELEMSEFEMPGSFGFSLIARAQRSSNICGGVIADAIGAGKTVISIAIILQGIEKARASREEPRESGASLVVVPPGLIDQWASEIKKFAPSLTVIKIYDFKTLAKATLGQMIEADVVIAPIDILQSDGYLQNLVEKAELSDYEQSLPALPPYSGQIEQNAARGVWIPHTSTDPYAGGNNVRSQGRRNESAFYTYVYQKAIDQLRTKTFQRSVKGIPLEYFTFERLFADEIHESLCTTKVELNSAKDRDKETGVGFFKEKNRRAGRELLGISQKDISKRPLVFRKSIFGLTGTPLLDSSSRVIELANLMGGTYVIGLSSHWRKLERESCRDIFLHNYLEPKQSREIRKNIHEKCQQYLDVACCRNKSGEEMDGITQVDHREVVRMTEEEKLLYSKSQKGIPSAKQGLSITVEDFDPSAGHDISPFLRQNAKFASRGAKLLEICNTILEEEPTTKIIVFTDGRIGAGEAARDCLCGRDGPGCTWLDHDDSVEVKNRKIGWYQTGDATEEDRQRPRVLVLHFEHAAGLNLQTECHNLILFSPLYVGDGGTTGDPVSDASTELQAIGRVFRAGQTNPTVHVYRIEVEGPNGEECLDGQLIRRNTDEETVQMATNAGED